MLCLHGLTGTPYEVRPLAEALVARGLRAVGPWMAGHEAGHTALARTPHAEWIALADRALAELRATHARVFAVGVSMGGLVSLRLAQTGSLDGLVVVGTPLALPFPIPLLARLLRPLLPYRPKRGSDIQDPAARARHPGLEAMPLAAVTELVALQGLVAPALGQICAPILVTHGRLDRTAQPRDAERIHGEVASTDKALLYLERSGHVATVDHDGPALAQRTADFIDRLC
ncbi:alpha/beta fold hydrolase [Myxococcota bacterium]|nr:alpha/beta fold hydrolase [Myxococcota bacterium]